MKHYPAYLAEPSLFGAHGNECLRGCEHVHPNPQQIYTEGG